MKKSILIFAFIIILSSISFAEKVDFTDIIEKIEENNNGLKILDYNLDKLKFEVDRGDVNARNVKVTLDGIYDKGHSVRGEGLRGLFFLRDVLPTQLHDAYDGLVNQKEVTSKFLQNNTRDLMGGLLNLELTIELLKKKESFYKSEYNAIKLKYDLGVVSKTDVLSAEVKYFKSKTDLKINQRNYKNYSRSLNQLTASKLGVVYNIKAEEKINSKLKDSDFYIKRALKNRLELLNIKNSIKLFELKIDNYNQRDFLMEHSNKLIYEDLKRDKLLELIKLKNEMYSIVNDISSAVSEIIIFDAQIKQLESTLVIQKNNYNTLMASVNQGYITKSAIKELEFAIENIEINITSMKYSYNSKRRKLSNATLTGPKYGGGM